MSSSSSVLSTIQNQLNLYGNSILVIVGNIGNIFIVILFSRQRQNACAIYLISSAIGNAINLMFSGLAPLFPVDYTYETASTWAVCRIRIYLANVFGQIPKTLIALACVDRFMITSRRASFRAFSTPKRTKWLVFFTIIFWALFGIPLLLMHIIIRGQCTRTGIYTILYSVYTIIFVGSIPLIVMSLFGYLTYRNMKQIHVRVQPIGHNINESNSSVRRHDRNLLIIVISEVLVYIVTAILFPLVSLEMMISQYVISNKSSEYSQIERFILNLAYFLLLVNSAIPFYIYLISSKAFRRDFKQLIIDGYRKLRRQPLLLDASRTRDHSLLTQRETRV